MLDKVKNEVESLLENDNSGHGMEHISRVLNLSLEFADAEKANKDIVALIALLHDVDDYKLFGQESSEKLFNARKIMDNCNIDKDTQEQVCSAIKTIGYGKRLKGVCPTTLEGKIVSDADMCDALGANGILRTFMYQIKNNTPFFDRNFFPIDDLTADKYKTCAETGISHFFDKILRINSLLLTNSGKREGKYRHQFTVDFLYHFFDEERADEWKTYLDNFLKNYK